MEDGEEEQVEGVQPEEVRPYITFLRADEMDRFLRLGPQYLFRVSILRMNTSRVGGGQVSGPR